MFRLLRRTALLGGVGYNIYDYNTDEQLVLRSMRTIKVGLQILYNYKICFNENNVNDIHEHIAKEMYLLCKNNDGLYVKFGQMVSASEHMMPPVFLHYFSQLQDQAKPGNPKKVQEILKTELGEDYLNKFEYFDPEPVAAASIAQVHKARLKDGSEVAVKIQKPNIRRQFGSDMTFHYLFCYMLDRAFDMPFLSFAKTVEDNLRKEIDFNLEAENAEQIRADLQTMNRNNIYVPKIYHEYTNNRILVMEWVDAIKITNYEELQKNNLNVQQLIKTCIEVFAEQIFVTGFVHCDPHPGNLMARNIINKQGKKEWQIVMLDFGLCLPIENNFRLKYCEFWQALFLQDTNKMKEIARGWGVLDEEIFASSILMRPYKSNKPLSQEITKEEVYELQFKLKQDMKKMMSDMDRFPKDIMFIGRNMTLVRSLNKRIGSQINRINLMVKYAVQGLNYENVAFEDQEHHTHLKVQQKSITKVKKYRLGINTSDLSVILFSCRLFVSGCLYKLVQFWLKLTRNQSFEEYLDQEMKRVMEDQYKSYGMLVPDEKTFDA